MAIRVGINGFGRIGRQVMRAAKQQGVADLDFVAVNDLTDTETLAHLFKYDSVHGTYEGDVSHDADGITIDGDRVRILAEKDPAKLPWKDLGVEEGHHLGAGDERGHHDRHGRQQRQVRPGQASHRVERVVHDELPRADGEGRP
jgi:glyceraldehyde-3-phosphate dehydrogenase/erythrose-4-phosphate dehydrogenase